MAILTHRPPYVAACGVMMSPDDCERVGRLIRLSLYDWRFVAVRPAGTHFSSVSLTLDDVRCHGPELLVARFLTAWGDVPFHFWWLTRVPYWAVQFDSHFGFFTGLACRPADLSIALFGWWLLS